MSESKQKQRGGEAIVAVRFYHDGKQKDVRTYDLRVREGREQLIRAISWATANVIPFDGLTASAESPDSHKA